MLQDVLRDANDTSKPLDSVLRTAMVFAYSLGYQPLVDWVNAELDGYLPGSELPDYRSFRSEVHARFTDGYRLGPIQRISEYAFPEEWRDQVTRVQLRKGVRSLEDNSDRTDIVQNLPSYAVSYLKKIASYRSWCHDAWLDIPPGEVAQVISAVRTRLMRFCLTIRNDFPPSGRCRADRCCFRGSNACRSLLLQHDCYGRKRVCRNRGRRYH